jgi:hypothetical protein
MYKSETWSTDVGNKATIMRRALAYLSIHIRSGQYKKFKDLLKPNAASKVLDVGVSPDENSLVDTNFFIKKYPYKRNLTAASVEDCRSLFRKKYPQTKFVQIKPGKKLPFKDKSFDIVVSWATIEHVGTRDAQKFFLDEISRVGKKIFVTTPNKNFFYELHSGLFFIHWLPHKYFSFICKLLGKSFWANIKNLNPLNLRDIGSFIPKNSRLSALSYKSFGILPTHILVYKAN